MKAKILLLFGFLAALSGVAYVLAPAKTVQDKIPLVWATDANPQRDAQVAKFNEKYPDCVLRIDPDNTGTMKVIVQSCSRMGPDLIDHVSYTSFQTYVNAGVLMDVTDAAKQWGFGLDTLHPKVRSLVTMKTLMPDGSYADRQYVYPCNVANSFMIYNKNIFDKYGIPYPSEDLTWDEYLELARKLTVFEGGEKRIPSVFGAAGVSDKVVVWEHGADFLNKDGTRSGLDDPRFLDAMVFLHDLYFKHNVEPTKEQQAGVTTQGGWGSGYRNWFGQEKLAMYWGSRWMLIQFRRFIDDQKKAIEKWEKAHPGEEYKGPKLLRMGSCLVPRFDDGPRYSDFAARCTGINVDTKDKEAGYKFLQYLAGKEYSDIINQGADSKPGNVAYYRMEEFINPTYPGEEQVHEMSLKSIEYSRVPPMSPFITYAAMDRHYRIAYDKITTDTRNELDRDDIARILRETSGKINLEIARNIKRDGFLRKLYEKLLKDGAEPIVLNLEDVR